MGSTGSDSFKRLRSPLGRPLSEGLDKRLTSYATAARAAGVASRALESAGVITRAASAAGVGLLLSTGPASARIVYTPAYTPLPPFESIFLDLNHDGINDFGFFRNSGSSIIRDSYLRVSPAQAGNAILGKIQGALSQYGAPLTCHVASALPPGHRIGPGSRFGAYATIFYGAAKAFAAGTPFFVFNCGYWGKAQGRFLGFEFTVHGQTHFGWARLTVSASTSSIPFLTEAVLTGYAYETEPGKPIRAGDTGPVADTRAPQMDSETRSAPPTVATLRPATLGLLALGSAGLDIWRKEQ